MSFAPNWTAVPLAGIAPGSKLELNGERTFIGDSGLLYLREGSTELQVLGFPEVILVTSGNGVTIEGESMWRVDSSDGRLVPPGRLYLDTSVDSLTIRNKATGKALEKRGEYFLVPGEEETSTLLTSPRYVAKPISVRPAAGQTLTLTIGEGDLEANPMWAAYKANQETRETGWILVGSGGGGLLVSGILAAMSSASSSESEDLYSQYSTTQDVSAASSLLNQVDEADAAAQNYMLASGVFAALGAGIAGWGAYLLLTNPAMASPELMDSIENSMPSLSLSPWSNGQDTWGLGLSGGF